MKKKTPTPIRQLKPDNYIFSGKPQKESEESEATKDLYTVIGHQDFLDIDGNPRLRQETEEVLAKKEARTRYVKMNDAGIFFNPISMYESGKGVAKYNKRKGKKEYQFHKVSKEVFDYYVNFLRTKNEAWLRLAERSKQ